MKNIRIFYLEIFSFLVVKFSIYSNRRVFVMGCNIKTTGCRTVSLKGYLLTGVCAIITLNMSWRN